MSVQSVKTLPLPSHYDAAKVTDLRFIDYGGLFQAALDWRKRNALQASANDYAKVALLNIDNQYTFCHPKGELFVAGRSGNGAVEDSRRLVEFVYQNLGVISDIHNTLDTHRAYAIFHPTFMVDENGNHPAPFSLVTAKEVAAGKWTATQYMASALGVNLVTAQRHLVHYTEELEKKGRYALTIWPFHGMLGGPGHAVVSGLEEACFFHAVARGAQTGYEVKGTNPWTENYSVLGPEVVTTDGGRVIAQRNTRFIEQLLKYDVLIIAGQAKSHCVAWTIEDLLGDIAATDPALASKVYLLEDCTSPVVVPGLDYTDDANRAFDKFKAAGMHAVKSTDPIDTWPGIKL
jgi:nicotinamidase-related amidase